MWQGYYTRPETKPVDFAIDPLLHALMGISTPHHHEHHVVKIIRQLAYVNIHKMEEFNGNLLITVGKDPSTMFSCHMDIVGEVSKKNAEKNTVDRISFMTPVDQGKNKENKGFIYGAKYLVDPETDQFVRYEPSTLGADDKVGCYILLKMIQNKIPGLYAFHVGEEIGGVGSKYLSTNKKEYFSNIKRAIAFDRAGYSDIIEHQRGGRCCSPEFGTDLANKLNVSMPPFTKFKGGIHGTFTDTANYRDIIPECTNVSVGYFDQHGSKERLDYVWLRHILLPAILKIDYNTLITKRNPKETTTVYSYNQNKYLNKKSWKEVTEETPRWELPVWTPSMGVVPNVKPNILKKAINQAMIMCYTIEEKDKFSDGIYNVVEKNYLLENEIISLKAQIKLLTKRQGNGTINSNVVEDEEIKQKKAFLTSLCEVNITLTKNDVFFKAYANGAKKFLKNNQNKTSIDHFSQKELKKLNRMIYMMSWYLEMEEKDLAPEVDQLLKNVSDFILVHCEQEGFEIPPHIRKAREEVKPKPTLLIGFKETDYDEYGDIIVH